MTLVRASIALAALALLAACGGGGGGSTPAPAPTAQDFLTSDDVRKIVGQAVAEANARNIGAVVTVVDRVGNVLATYATPTAPNAVVIDSGLGVTDGLEIHMPAV